MSGSLVDGDVTALVTGQTFTEGPLWLGDHGCLLFTDIPANVIRRWGPDGTVRDWVANSHFAIGLSRDTQGRVLVCEHSTRALTALAIRADGAAGERTVLADRYLGRVLNSTNDVICTRDGTVMFTDPPFGVRELEGGLHGYQQAMELPACNVFRTGDRSDSPVSLTHAIYRPNGLCLSLDESRLYVSDSSETHHKVLVGDVGPGWTLANIRDFAVMPVGVPDGMRLDVEGNLWVAGGDGVYVFGPDGGQRGHVPVPEMVTNLEFGGDDRRDLFITATSSVYHVRTQRPGAAKPGRHH